MTAGQLHACRTAASLRSESEIYCGVHGIHREGDKEQTVYFFVCMFECDVVNLLANLVQVSLKSMYEDKYCMLKMCNKKKHKNAI